MQYKGDNMLGIKRSNRSALLRILHEQGWLSRKRLAEAMNLTPAAISKITGDMLEEGLIVEGKSLESSSAGRREIALNINEKYRCALGLFINLRQVILSATWLDGSVIFSEEIEIEPASNAEALAESLSKRILELVEAYSIPKSSVLGIGIAVRGITSADGRTVKNSFGALDSLDCPLAQLVEHYSGLPVIMANNVRSLLAAHIFMHCGNDFRSRFFLRCEYGIGASLSIDGKIWHGGSERCAEIGHIPTPFAGSKKCSCGKTGCLETVASPASILEDSKLAMCKEDTPFLWNLSKNKSEITLNDVFTAAMSGDKPISAIVERAVDSLAIALKGVIGIIDPEEIVLYGRMFDNSYYYSLLIKKMCEGEDPLINTEIRKSQFNHLLENKAACLLQVDNFIINGGL